MATFDKKFGIKEVADVGFYTVGTVKVGTDGTVTATAKPVLTLDTLKVSKTHFFLWILFRLCVVMQLTILL